jgi:hypothetical protein
MGSRLRGPIGGQWGGSHRGIWEDVGMETMTFNQKIAVFFNQITRLEPGHKTGFIQGGNLRNNLHGRKGQRLS